MNYALEAVADELSVLHMVLAALCRMRDEPKIPNTGSHPALVNCIDRLEEAKYWLLKFHDVAKEETLNEPS